MAVAKLCRKTCAPVRGALTPALLIAFLTIPEIVFDSEIGE
jgi:hypothetical protein